MTMNKDPESIFMSIQKVGQVKAFHICEPPASSEYLCRMVKARGPAPVLKTRKPRAKVDKWLAWTHSSQVNDRAPTPDCDSSPCGFHSDGCQVHSHWNKRKRRGSEESRKHNSFKSVATVSKITRFPSHGRVEWGGQEDGGSRGRGYMYTRGWFMLMYGRNQHNMVKQLSSKKNFLKKPWENSQMWEHASNFQWLPTYNRFQTHHSWWWWGGSC